MLRNGHGAEQVVEQASILRALSLFPDEPASTAPREVDAAELPVGAHWPLLAIVSTGIAHGH